MFSTAGYREIHPEKLLPALSPPTCSPIMTLHHYLHVSTWRYMYQRSLSTPHIHVHCTNVSSVPQGSVFFRFSSEIDRDSLHWFLNFLQPSQVPFFSREELALHPVEPCSPTHVLPSVSALFCLFFSPKRQQHIPFRWAIPIPHHNCIYSDARGC
jgi:hypothetical protein